MGKILKNAFQVVFIHAIGRREEGGKGFVVGMWKKGTSKKRKKKKGARLNGVRI